MAVGNGHLAPPLGHRPVSEHGVPGPIPRDEERHDLIDLVAMLPCWARAWCRPSSYAACATDSIWAVAPAHCATYRKRLSSSAPSDCQVTPLHPKECVDAAS